MAANDAGGDRAQAGVKARTARGGKGRAKAPAGMTEVVYRRTDGGTGRQGKKVPRWYVVLLGTVVLVDLAVVGLGLYEITRPAAGTHSQTV